MEPENKQSEQQDLAVKTSCKECVFAEYIGKTQMSCSLNRLQQFRKNLVTVDDAYDEEDWEFCVIHRFCNAYRNRNWKENLKKDRDIKSAVEKEIEIQLDFVIIIPFDINPSTVYLKTSNTIKSIVGQTIRPVNLIFIGQKNTADLSGNVESAKEQIAKDYETQGEKDSFSRRILAEQIEDGLEGTGIGFVLMDYLLDDSDYFSVLDEAFKRVYSTYYSVLLAGEEIEVDYIEKLNNVMNKELRVLSVVEPDDGSINRFTAQSGLHKLFLGSKTGIPINKVIREFADYKNEKDFIYKWSEI